MSRSFSVILCFVVFFNVEAMRDPHDMFEIFKDSRDTSQFEDSSEKINLKTENDSSSTKVVDSGSCKMSVSSSCKSFFDTVLKSLHQQLPTEEEIDDRDYYVSLGFLLTLQDVTILKELDHKMQHQNELCTILQESLDREQSRTLMTIAVSWLNVAINAFFKLFYDLKYYLVFAFQYTTKDFVLLMWLATFISSVVIANSLRSIRFALGWILMCVVFTSTYTTYQQLYEEKATERWASLLPHGGAIPKDCLNPEKSWFQTKILEPYFTGKTPVKMSQECENYLKKMNIAPELEIHLSDALSKTIFRLFSNSLSVLVSTADEAAEKISGKYTFCYKWLVYCFIYGSLLLLTVVLISLLAGQSLSFYGLRISRPPAGHIAPHRTVVEQIPCPQIGHQGVTHILPPASWVHDLVQLASTSTEQRIQTQMTEDGLRKKSITQPKPVFKKLKSVGGLLPAPSRRENMTRRLSF